MRCPKCGYISYDNLETCLKCKKDIRAVSESLNGGVYRSSAPVFLRFREEEQEEDILAIDEFEEDDSAADFLDEDLQVLVAEDEPQINAVAAVELDQEIDLDLESASIDFEQEEEELQGEIEIDLGQFEQDSKVDELASLETAPAEEVDDSRLQMPASLSDISDLVAPPLDEQKREDAQEDATVGEADLEGADFSLDDLDFDLGLDTYGDMSQKALEGDGPSEEGELSLDDIDFSDTLSSPTTPSDNRLDSMDMDDDLNFDLDLGGLSIHKDV